MLLLNYDVPVLLHTLILTLIIVTNGAQSSFFLKMPDQATGCIPGWSSVT